MLRQFYYGKQFFRREFGLDMKILWLPDSFGYSACLPQVMKLAGVPYFLTQKMSWNTVNKFPYHTFRWQSRMAPRCWLICCRMKLITALSQQSA